jgi:hypothetical protein
MLLLVPSFNATSVGATRRIPYFDDIGDSELGTPRGLVQELPWVAITWEQQAARPGWV